MWNQTIQISQIFGYRISSSCYFILCVNIMLKASDLLNVFQQGNFKLTLHSSETGYHELRIEQLNKNWVCLTLSWTKQQTWRKIHVSIGTGYKPDNTLFDLKRSLLNPEVISYSVFRIDRWKLELGVICFLPILNT